MSAGVICKRAVVAAVAACALALAAASPAMSAFGDDFGIAPINGHEGGQATAAIPGPHAFWAGACDRALAPPIGEPIPGGVGSRPASFLAPSNSPPQSPVPAPAVAAHCIDWGAEGPYGGPNSALWNQPPAWRLPSVTQAGAHPDGSTTFAFKRDDEGFADGTVDNIVVDLPAGFVGDPRAVPKCTAEQFASPGAFCPPETQVGVLHLDLIGAFGAANMNWGGVGGGLSNQEILPVYNLEPRKGKLAELGFGYASGENAVAVRIVAKARTNGDFGISALVAQIPAALPVIAQAITVWGVPWAETNDLWRAPRSTPQISPSGLDPADRVSYDPSWGPIKPFFSNLSECSGSEVFTRLATDAYQHPGAWTSDGDPALPDPIDNSQPGWKVYDSAAPPVTGCEKVPFDAGFAFDPGTSRAGGPAGLSVDLSIPQNDDPPAAVAQDPDEQTGAPGHWRSDAGLATSHLDRAVVTLPAGFSVNPSGATGLQSCSDAEIGLVADGNPPRFNNVDPFDGTGVECPAGSKLGTVRVDTPLLDQPLLGELVLGDPRSTDPRSGQMLRLFIVVRDPDRGLVAKVAGHSIPDGTVGAGGSGQITAIFDKNPRVPFEHMHLQLRGGPRGLLAMPRRCGPAPWSSTLAPWSAAHNAGGRPVASGGAFVANQDCAFGFRPTLTARTDNRRGGSPGGTFSFELTRLDGEQWLQGLTAKLPKGLLADVSGVPLCSDGQAAAGACPEASRIGVVDASAGAGDPFVIEQKGAIYLTDGYKGCPYGLAVKVRAIAGPFRGPMELTPIVVRQAVCVNRRTAQVTAVSDPLPTTWHGVPLRIRRILVNVDRTRFMQNPTDCSPKRVRANLASPDGAAFSTITPFQMTDCDRLRFKPKLRMRLTGRRQTTTGRHPGIRARVTQRRGEAAIKRAVVHLPKSLALDVNNARALCEFDHGTKPDLESHCPKGSIVGRARAASPLLKEPLKGNVYFVKNVRIDKQTGNEIRTLPMIIVALRGEIAINLRGISDTTKAGKLVNKFTIVPDAPVRRFNLNIKGGKNGILAITRTRRSTIDICDRRQIARTAWRGHNAKRHNPNIRLKTPCNNKRQAAKRKRNRNA